MLWRKLQTVLFPLLISFYQNRQRGLPAGDTIKILLIIFVGLFLTASPTAEEKKGELDGISLVCRRDDLYFSRPYYFIFENRTVLGPWVTIDTAIQLKGLRATEYQSTASVASWAGHTLTLDTLQLEEIVNGILNRLYRCEIMNPKHMAITLQRKDDKLEKD